MVEFTINNHQSATTGHSPFFLNYGLHPKVPSDRHLPDPPVPAAKLTADEIMSTIAVVKDLIRESQDVQADYANRLRHSIEFSIGDQVLLYSTPRHIEPLNPAGSPKLLPRYSGPFYITEQINPVAYRIHQNLGAPKDDEASIVTHVSRLRRYEDPSTFSANRPVPPCPPPVLVDDEEEYEVKRILDKCTQHRKIQYLVKWLGYPDSDNSWEPVTHLRNTQDLIDDFESSRTPS